MQDDKSVPALPAAGGTRLRASDADRDAAAAVLNAAFAEGRLTAGEHEQRLGAAYGARTWQQLRQVTADLPAPAESVPLSGMPAGVDWCLLCVLLIVCPPAGIAWWLLSRRRPAADPPRPLPVATSAGGGAISDHGNRHAQDR